MSAQYPDDLDARMRQLEAELEQSQSVMSSEKRASIPSSELMTSVAGGFISWLSQLPAIGKVIALAAILLVGLSVIRGILQLVTFGISLVLLLAILYGIYKAFFAPTSQS
jgi:hypothetical protein